MSNVNYKQFLSGTDIRGIALEGVEGEHINLTDEVCTAIAAAYALWLSEKLQKPTDELTVAVGHDSRVSADRIASAVFSGLTAAGITVLDCGLSSTPAMFMITQQISSSESMLNADGAIQITASHHPFNRNGLKFFTAEGGLNSSDVSAILKFTQNDDRPLGMTTGEIVKCDFMREYANILREIIKKGVNTVNYDRPLFGFKIVVDAGNGAGGFYAKEVLEPLGADIEGSLFLEPDGYFPNHIPNPEDPTAMDFITKATVAANADLGVIFDTDVDRAGCVTVKDGVGRELNRNRLVALAAALALEEHPGGSIVTDSITSDGLKEFIETTLGGKHVRFKRGYKNVINEALRRNDEGEVSPLAIETSGHAAFMDNYFLDDGAYLITKIIIKMAQLKKTHNSLDDLLSDLKEPAESSEVRFKITGEDWRSAGLRTLEELAAFTAEHADWVPAADNHEGYRVNIPECDGWFLLRMSVHDPVMPLNFESNAVGGNKKIAELLRGFFEKQTQLDSSKFIDYLNK